jgi:hypothetical protein
MPHLPWSQPWLIVEKDAKQRRGQRRRKREVTREIVSLRRLTAEMRHCKREVSRDDARLPLLDDKMETHAQGNEASQKERENGGSNGRNV